MVKQHTTHWNAARADEFYNIPAWGEGYFYVNEYGHIAARLGDADEIDLHAVSLELSARKISFPVLVRLPQILCARIGELCKAFTHAIEQSDIETEHTPLYPIKVNQQRTVVEHVLSSHVSGIGLEVGSKTELLAALGLLDSAQGLLVCNGYKDRSYIRIALHAQRMGMRVFIVIEKLSELALIIKESTRLGVIPKLGVRVRLNSIAAGKWQNTGGRNSKFGLGTQDLLRLLEDLKKNDFDHCLQLLHFHMGSQISRLDDFSLGLREAMQIYRQLRLNDIDIRYIDVGGGLAIDYSAQHNEGSFSKAYSMQAYADVVINTIGRNCKKYKLPIPQVFSENGRAMTAHHAVLITNVVEVERKQNGVANIRSKDNCCETLSEFADQIGQAKKEHKSLPKQMLDNFEQQIEHQFIVGEIDLQQRSMAECYLQECRAMQNERPGKETVADKYYCNFSIFQSMPDIWGLDQIFPIVPLARLNEEPTEQARLHDLTCDSDGQISTYTYEDGLQCTLPLHPINPDEDYVLGCFLVGAYQEILGDVHNLFGDTHTANVERGNRGELIITELETGDCVDELLRGIHLDSDQVMMRCQQRITDYGLSQVDQESILTEIEDALFSYTYLDSVDRVTHRIKGNKHA